MAESGTTMFKADGRHKDGPKKGQIKWVRYHMSSRALYHGRYIHFDAVELVKKLANKLRISKHRVTKSTHRHQAR